MDRQALHDKLDAFLEKQEGDGYGWPEVSREDFGTLYEIISEIADQKFKRDCDGDQVIQFALGSRKRGRLVYATIPHDPGCDEFTDEKTEEIAWKQWFYDATRAAHMLISQGSEILRLIPDYMHRQNTKEV